jgi:hypothetical protein
MNLFEAKRLAALERDEEKRQPVFRPHPAFIGWDRSRSGFPIDSIQSHRNLSRGKTFSDSFGVSTRRLQQMVPPPLNRRQLLDASDLAGYSIVIGLKNAAAQRPALARLRFVSLLKRPLRRPWLFFWPRVDVRLRASERGNAPVLGPWRKIVEVRLRLTRPDGTPMGLWSDQGLYRTGETVMANLNWGEGGRSFLQTSCPNGVWPVDPR